MKKLIAVGTHLGYQDQQFPEFVKEQQTLEGRRRKREEERVDKEAEAQREREAMQGS